MQGNDRRIMKDRMIRYISVLTKWRKKIMWVSDISMQTGIVEDVVREDLAQFDPLVRLLPDYNVLQLLPELEIKFTIKLTKSKPRAKTILKYDTVLAFVVSEMTLPGGIIDRSVNLTKSQLKELRKAVNNELKMKRD